MKPAPAVLTPERIDAMLSSMAEACMEAVELASARLKAAADAEPEAFERANRALQAACRNLRQTIALKQRFDREQLKLAAEQRRDTQEVRREADGARQAAVASRRRRIHDHFDRVLWNECEADDAREFLEDLDVRLVEISLAEDFLDTPLEAVIARLAKERGIHLPGEPFPAIPPGRDDRSVDPQPPPDPPPWERPPPGAVVRGGSGW